MVASMLGTATVARAAATSEDFDSAGFLYQSATSLSVGTWTFTSATTTDLATLSSLDGPLNLNGDGGGSDRCFAWNLESSSAATFAFKSSDGTDFALNSFKLGSVMGDTTVTVSGWRDGVQVVSGEAVDLTASDSVGNISYSFIGSVYGTLTFSSAFANVDEIRLVFSGPATVEMDDLSVSTAVVPPTLTSATYNAGTGVLAVTAANMTTGDTIDTSKLTLTGQGGSTYTLTSGSVAASSAVAFSVTLNATDKLFVNGLLNKNGTSSVGGTTYNLAAAANWDSTAGGGADSTGNGIVVSNVTSPAITSATYNASTHVLAVTGNDFVRLVGSDNDITVSALTLTGEGGFTYALTTSNVDVANATSFSITLNATDRAAVEQLLNKNGTVSTGGTTYALAAADDWNSVINNTDISDSANAVTVSNVPAPAITSATFNVSTGALTVTGSGFLSLAGASNDIVANKFTFTGESGATYTLTDTGDVELDSQTAFTVALSATDRAAVSQLLNKNGTSSTGGTTYNLAAAEDWAAGADAAVSIADTTGNGITVSNVAVPAITSATYDGATGALVVAGTGFLPIGGAANDIVANKFTLTGQGGATYTLTDTANVDLSSGTSFTLTLSATDRAALTSIINKDGTSSLGGTTYNLAAAEDWAAGADAAVVTADVTGNAITASNADLVPPTIASVAVPSNATYVGGQNLNFTVNFSENVIVTTAGGTPSIALTIGSSGLTASYLSGSGTSALVFRYTVQTGDLDSDGIALGSLTLNGGTIRDAAGNNATLTLNNVGSTTAVRVDAVAPTVTGVAVPADATYAAGQHLDFSVTYGENVTVNTGGGTPYIVVTLDTGGSVLAAYSSGSGTTTLVFRYTIASGNLDADGIAVAGSITLNGGTVRDAAGNNAQSTSLGFGSTSAVLVDGVAPTVSSILRVNTSPTNATSVDYTVTFSEAVSGVDQADFTLTMTGTAAGSIAGVAALSGSTYTVTVDTLSGNGTVRLDLKNSGTGITDTPGNAIATGFTAGQTYTVDTTAPAVTSVGVPANATYVAGQNLDFTVNLDEAVTVNTSGGTPRIALTVGSATRYAGYLSGSGTAALVFRYTVQTGDLDNNGITVSGAIDANGGTLRDVAGNALATLLNNVGSAASVLVDAEAPAISGATVPADGTYAAGQNLDVTVTYSENVTVNTAGGTPSLAVTLNTGGSVQATYLSGSGTATLAFRYVVASGNLDADGIDLGSSLTLNGGTLQDAAGNNAATTGIGFPSTAGVLVDGVAPTVDAIARQTPSASATNATSVIYRVTFSEAVTGVDAADFVVTATSSAAGSVASVSSVSTSVYDVIVNAISGDGTLRLDLKNAGTGIADGAGNAIAAGFTAGQTYTVDNAAPAAASILRQTPAVVTTAATSVTWRITFDETVTGVDTADFILAAVSGAATGSIGSVVSVSGSVYDIAVTSVSGTGALRLDLKASGTGITDEAGNALSGGFATGDLYVIGSENVFDTVSLAAGTVRSVSGATSAKVAQRFTTSASLPLTIAQVTAQLGLVTGTPVPVVTVNADHAGLPGSVVATLTNPSSLTANGLNTWTSTAVLSASTTYWLVFADSSAAGEYAIQETAATTGGVGAWLTNPDYVYLHGANAGTGPQAGALQIAIGANNIPAVTSPLAASGTYGSALAVYTVTATNSPTSFSATGLPAGLSLDSSTGVITGTPAAAGTFNVTLTATNGSGTSAPTTLVITIGKAPLTVTALSATRVLGTANPAFSVSYSGFVNGDTASSLATAPTATTSATILSPAGTYPITAAGGVSNNYNVSYVDGVLTITPPTSVAIALSGLAATYDGTPKGVTATTTPAGVPVTITYDGSASAPTKAGTYAVAATVSAIGYTGSVAGTLVIERAPQTIAFAPLPDKLTNDGAFALSASTSSGLPVSFQVTTGPATLTGGTVTLKGQAGSVTVVASQAGNENFQAAPSVTRSFAVHVPGPRIYLGDLVGGSGVGRLGDLAAVLPPTGNDGHVLIVAPGANLELAFDFALKLDGSFERVIVITDGSGATAPSLPGMPPTAAAVRTLTFRGQLSGNVLSGHCDEAGVSFSIAVQPRGETTSAAGFYEAPAINHASGTTYAIVGNNGEVVVLATAGDTVTSGRTTLSANGTFAVQETGVSVQGAIDVATTSVTGVISRAGAGDVSFSGVAATTPRTDRLINLSSRSRVGPSADRTLITGFVIGGAQSKRVLLRAVGPTLDGFGVGDSLPNPTLRLYDHAGQLLLENDDWSGAEAAAAFVQTGAFQLPTGARDSALVATLPPGAYTVHVTGGGTSGTALAEIYDASVNQPAEYQRLVNISSRGVVDDAVLIGGFVVAGNTPKRMLIRGVGPSLATLGVTGALVDPKLAVYRGQAKIAENDNWGSPVATGANQIVAAADEVAAAARATGAFGLVNGTRDAALVITLAPGAYTAQVGSVTGSTGVALVEIYEIPE